MWEQLATSVLCLMLVIGAVAAAVWALVTGQVEEQGIDALFLILIALIVAGAFGSVLLSSLRRGALRDRLPRKRAAAAVPEESKQPAGREVS